MATFQPPPTYAEVVLIDEQGKHPRFNPIWLKWFVDVARALAAAAGSGSGTLNHNALTGLQGGVADEYYHLSAAQLSEILAALPPAGVLALPTHTVAGLPAGVLGHIALVTDATATMALGVGTIVAGTGANKVPVYYDGTNWRIG